MSFLLTLHHEDDLLAIIDRVLTAPDDDVVIVIPEGARVLGSEENFELLKREADAGGKNISVRTADARGRFLANKAGIAVVRSAPPPSNVRRTLSDIVPPSGGIPVQMLPQHDAATFEEEDDIAEPAVEEAHVEPVVEAREEEQPAHLTEILHEEEASESDEGQASLPLAQEHEEVAEEPLPFLRGGRGEKKEKRQGRRMPSFSLPSFSLNSKAAGVGIVLVGVIVAFLVANEVLPNVDIRIRPQNEVVSFTLPLTVAVGDAATEGAVPGQRVSVNDTEERTVPASGEAERNERASGVITIINAFSSAPQTLVGTTRFVSQNGTLFRLDQTTVVPGAQIVDGEIQPSEIDARVTADEPGEEYNIGPSTFSIPGFQGSEKFNKFTARSSAPMTGGSKGTVKVVTEDDVAEAREGITDGLDQKLEDAFMAQVVDSLIVIDEAKKQDIVVTVDVEAGATADTVNARAEGSLSAIAYRQSDLEEAAIGALRARIPVDTDVVEGSTTILPTVIAADVEGGTLSLEVSIEARAAWSVNEALVKEAVAGQDEAAIRSWLATYDAVKHAQVGFRPFWITTAPDNPERIKVDVGLDAF